MNWVERAFAREDHLQTEPRGIWQKVLTAIQDACNSFAERRGQDTVRHSIENGHAVLVNVEFPRQQFAQGFVGGTRRFNEARVVFENQGRTITATLNGGSSQRFQIEGDENGCFILQGKERIDADRLSELALSGAFFKEPPEPQRHTPEPQASDWMR